METAGILREQIGKTIDLVGVSPANRETAIEEMIARAVPFSFTQVVVRHHPSCPKRPCSCEQRVCIFSPEEA